MAELNFQNKKKYTIIGCMSGTSLDGLDIAACEFEFVNGNYQYKIISAETINYDDNWKAKLLKSNSLSGLELTKLDWEFGDLIGKQVKKHIIKNNLLPDIIASHGHTVFHQPESGFTLQIGRGNEIVKNTGILTINDFRVSDVSYGGQGAPLVPIGDALLFPEYECCVNLGGFANISFESSDGICDNSVINIENTVNKLSLKNRIAFDICPVNILLNYFAQVAGKEYDNKGEMAKAGTLNTELLIELNKLEYYKLSAPKSLGKEWLDSIVLPIIDNYKISTNDKLRTIVEHAKVQILASINGKGKILISGGGVHNKFLIEQIKSNLDPNSTLIIPSKAVIDYKEALVFAFLGLLRFQGKVNCLSSVTGAHVDNIGGIIHIVS